MKNKGLYALLIGFVFLCLSACNNNAKHVNQKTIDTLDIWVDTSLAILINEQRKAYENDYFNPVVRLQYKRESNIIKELMDNQLNCAILQRKLTQKESDFFKKKEEFTPKQYVIAHDAMVFIANADFLKDVLTTEEIEHYFTLGTVKDFQLVFESNTCQAIPYFKSFYDLTDAQLTKAYSKNGLPSLLSFLKMDKQSIGIIPFSYITDIDAKSTIDMLKGLKVLSVKYSDSSKTVKTINPSQESITTKEYPYIMPIVLVNCNMEKKSGTTFVNYIFKPKAQRLFLKCGMVPAIFPGREVNVNTN